MLSFKSISLSVGRILALLVWLPLGVFAEYSATIRADKAHARTEPSPGSPIVSTFQRGDTVTVLEDGVAPIARRTGDEPWSRIRFMAIPSRWVARQHVDLARWIVTAERLNVRAGPGTQFDVVDQLRKGESVEMRRTSGDWVEIGGPSQARTAYLPTALLAPVSPPPSTPSRPAPASPTPSSPPRLTAAPPPAPPDTAARPPAGYFETVESRPATQRSTPPPPPPAQEPVRVLPPSTYEPAPDARPLSQRSETPVSVPQRTAPRQDPRNPGWVDVIPPPQRELPPPPPPVWTPSTVSEAPAVPTAQPAPAAPLPRVPARVTPPRQPALQYTEAPRTVQRDGVVQPAFEPISPTFFELRSHRGEGLIHYLYAEEESGIRLSSWVGRRVLITGDEVADPRSRRYTVVIVRDIRETF